MESESTRAMSRSQESPVLTPPAPTRGIVSEALTTTSGWFNLSIEEETLEEAALPEVPPMEETWATLRSPAPAPPSRRPLMTREEEPIEQLTRLMEDPALTTRDFRVLEDSAPAQDQDLVNLELAMVSLALVMEQLEQQALAKLDRQEPVTGKLDRLELVTGNPALDSPALDSLALTNPGPAMELQARVDTNLEQLTDKVQEPD